MLQMLVIQRDVQTGGLGVTAGGLEMQSEADVAAALSMVDAARIALTEKLIELRVEKRISPPVEKEEPKDQQAVDADSE